MSKLSEKYKSLSDYLIEMKEEYKIMPSKFLLKKIELAEKKMNQINDLIPKNTGGGGEYNPIPKYEKGGIEFLNENKKPT